MDREMRRAATVLAVMVGLLFSATGIQAKVHRPAPDQGAEGGGKAKKKGQDKPDPKEEKKKAAQEKKEKAAQEKKEKAEAKKAEKEKAAQEKKEKAEAKKAEKEKAAQEKKEKAEAKKAEKEKAAQEKKEKAEAKKKDKKKKGEEPVVLEDEPTPEPTPPPSEPEPAVAPQSTEPSEAPREGEEADAAAAASTDDAPGHLYLGLRVGYGLPMGDASGDADSGLDRYFTGKIPIWIDLGYRFSPSFLIGAYGQYAFATLGEKACPDGGGCSGSVLRFGLQVQYSLLPEATVGPWVGLGVGYEIARGESDGLTFELKGFEFANLQAGIDFKASRAVAIGPFVSFSLGRYAAGEFVSAGTQFQGEVVEKAMHEWLVFGLRGAFSL